MLSGLTIVFSVSLILILLFFLRIFISEFIILDREEISSYECGFEHHSLSRIPLSLRYYFLTIIFLVFDIEIIFLIYLPFNLLGVYSFVWASLISFAFVIVLFFGLLYEWLDGRLDWVL